MLWNTVAQTVELGWDFYVPVILFVALIAMAVPVWAAIGSSAILMLLMSGDLPLSLVGERLFTGIDAFALTAIPLFILTGDVLVRTGLSRKFLDVAEALTCFTKGGFGSATVLVCGMFAAISGSDAAGAAAVGRMTIARLVEAGYPRPYACALVAAGACTGILIPPSIAYIIIGLVLGISASTLFLAALIPGLCILFAILITNLVVNRIYAYEGGGNLTFMEWLANLGRSLQIWLVCVYRARHHLLWHLLWASDAYRSRRNSRRGYNLDGFPPQNAELCGLSSDAGQLGQGQRRDPSDHRLFCPTGRSPGDHGCTTRLCDLSHRLTNEPWILILLMIGILIAAGCVMETTPNIVILAPILQAFGRKHRHERNPVLYHDDHRLGCGLHHAAAGP